MLGPAQSRPAQAATAAVDRRDRDSAPEPPQGRAQGLGSPSLPPNAGLSGIDLARAWRLVCSIAVAG